MTNEPTVNCQNLEASSFDQQRAAEGTWEALLSAGVFVEGDFIFASGQRATLKAEAEHLYDHPRQFATILGHYAAFPCVQQADVLLYVPDGWKQFMTTLGHELDKPVANTIKNPIGQTRYDFLFLSPADEDLARQAKQPLIGEDVVTTLGSVAGLRSLLLPQQNVHSLAMLLRGTVNPAYQIGLSDHYLLERHIPTDKNEFHRLFDKT